MLGRRTLLALAAAACCLGGCGQGTDAPELGPQTLRGAGGARAQWGAPAGRYEREAPRAVLMLIHGGGWKGADRQAFNAQKPIAVAYRRLGFATINVDYRAGA